MYPQSHFLFPLVLGLLLQKLEYVDPWWIAVAVLVGVFVDLDHPLHHFFKSGKFSIAATADDAFKKHIDDRTFLHHRFGMLITTLFLMIVFASFSYWTTAVALGYYSHMLLDHITADGRLLDNRTEKDYYGKGKPFFFTFFGYQIAIARFEIVFDVVMIVCLVVLFLF
jgi:hypothetical protein